MGEALGIAELDVEQETDSDVNRRRRLLRLGTVGTVLTILPSIVPPSTVQAATEAVRAVPTNLDGLATGTKNAVQSFLRSEPVQSFERQFTLFGTAYADDTPPPPQTQQQLQDQVNALQAKADKAKQAITQEDIDFGNAHAGNAALFPWIPNPAGYSNPFPYGWCTYLSALNSNLYARTNGYVHGNAGQWIDEVNAYNRTVSADRQVQVSQTPVVGSIVIYKGPMLPETMPDGSVVWMDAGHNAVVTWVGPNGTYGGYEEHITLSNSSYGKVTPFSATLHHTRRELSKAFDEIGFIVGPPEAQAHYKMVQDRISAVQADTNVQKQALVEAYLTQMAKPLGETYAQAQQQLQLSSTNAQQLNDQAKQKRNDAAVIVGALRASTALAADQTNLKADQSNLAVAQANLDAAKAALSQAELTGVGLGAASDNEQQAQTTFDLANSQLSHDQQMLTYNTNANTQAQAALPASLQGADLTQLAQSKSQDASTAAAQAQAAAQQQQKDAVAAQAAAQALLDQRNAVIDTMGDTYGQAMNHSIKLLDQAQGNLDSANAQVTTAQTTVAGSQQVSTTTADLQARANGKQSATPAPEVVVTPPQDKTKTKDAHNNTPDNTAQRGAPDNTGQTSDNTTTTPPTQTGTPTQDPTITPPSTTPTQTPPTATPSITTPLTGHLVTFAMKEDLTNGGLTAIAAGHEVTVDQILAVNPELTSTSTLTVGEMIVLPTGARPVDYDAYLVMKGDDIQTISSSVGRSVAALTADNPGVNLTKLRQGELIFFSPPVDSSLAEYQAVHTAEASGASGDQLVTALAAQISQGTTSASQSESAQGSTVDPRVQAQKWIDDTTRADKAIAAQRAALQAPGGPTDQLMTALQPPSTTPAVKAPPVAQPPTDKKTPPAQTPPTDQYPAAWQTWAVGVLNGIGAPVNSTNLDTLWHWSRQESGNNVMRWDNPLNTTQWEPGAVAENTLSNPDIHVYAYPDIQTGIAATVATLTNGYYPHIVADLQNSVPRQQWTNADKDLGTWGTGASWLQ